MPFLDEDSPASFTPQIAEPVEVTTPMRPIGRMLSDALATDTSIGSAAVAFSQPGRGAPDPNFDPFGSIKGYEDHAPSFIHDNNEDDVAHTKLRIDEERKRTQRQGDDGLVGAAVRLAAGIADPITLIPVGGQLVAVSRAGRVLHGMLQTGIVSGLTTIPQEMILSGTQITRTGEESAWNIAGATLVGGILGGGVGLLPLKRVTPEFVGDAARGSEIVEREVTANMSPSAPPPVVGAVTAAEVPTPAAAAAAAAAVEPSIVSPSNVSQSAGAMGVAKTTIDEETIANALGIETVLARTSPTLRTQTDPSVVTRRVGQELADQPLVTKGQVEGTTVAPISVERHIAMSQAALAESLTGFDDLFVQYRLGRTRQFGDIVRITAGDLVSLGNQPLMSYTEFSDAVGRAMHNNDVSDVPEVAKAAAHVRKTIFDPWFQRAKDAGMLDEDLGAPKNAPSYMMVVHDVEKIRQNRPMWEEKVTNWLIEEQNKKDVLSRQAGGLVAELKDLKGKVAKREARIQRGEKAKAAIATRQEEVSRLNAFAFKRSSAMTKPIDALRETIRGIEGTISPQLSRLDEIAARLREVRDQYPEIKSIDAAMFKLIGAGQRMRQGAELIDVVEGGEAFSKAVQELRGSLRGGIAGKRIERIEAIQRLGAEDLTALEKARTEVGKEIRPYRRELKRVRENLGDELKRKGGAARGGAVFESEIRRRGNVLADQASGRSAAVDEVRGRLSKDQERILAIQTELEDIVKSWEGNTGRTARSALARRAEKEATREPDKPRLGEADKPVVKAARQMAAANTEMDVDYLRDIARQITDRIISSPTGRLPYDMEVPEARGRPSKEGPPPRGPLAQRRFMMPVEQQQDFLVNDIRQLMRMYNRTMASDVTLTEKFGSTEMTEQLQQINADYAEMMKGKSPEVQNALERRRLLALRDIEGIRDRLRGTYGLPKDPNGLGNRAFHIIRDLNYLRLLGGMTISALPDIGRTVMTHGLMRVAGDGIVPMVSNFKQFRLAAREVRLAGNALDLVTDSRSMAMADMLDDYGQWSKYERGMKAMTDKFGLVTLMAPWNAGIKHFTGVVGQTRTLQAIERAATGQTVAPAEITRLQHLYIDQHTAERIWEQFTKHGERGGPGQAWWANTEKWEDNIARTAYRAALSKEIDITIVTPGQERPFWMSSSALGRMVGQFRGFAFSSTQRVLLTGLQKRDMATLNGMLLMTGLGMMSYWIRHQLNPDAKALPDDPVMWVKEGIDRSGLTGWLFDAHNIVEKLTLGKVGMSALSNGPPMSRYASRHIMESLFGPTVGLIEGAGTAISATARGEWSDSEIKAVRRLYPYQTALGFRHLFDAAEQGLRH